MLDSIMILARSFGQLGVVCDAPTLGVVYDVNLTLKKKKTFLFAVSTLGFVCDVNIGSQLLVDVLCFYFLLMVEPLYTSSVCFL